MIGKRLKTAFILGAGLGTRLRPLTEACPKPLLPLEGDPSSPMRWTTSLRPAWIASSSIPTTARTCYADAFPDGHWRGVPILFRHEPLLLDTAGGLKNIEDAPRWG